ncbi:MAG: MFS transporter [Candidatus Liptonbacteria bacterium]|nr:MFS transporter [Candidatus Liptonbacteria bacterium]
MLIKIRLNFRTNRVVRNFIFVDLALLAGWGLVQPIFSIYVVRTVSGATLVTVGIAAAIYWILKSILQIPIANYLDRKPGEADDFRALVAGLLVAAFAAFSFGFIREIWHLYLVEVVHAIAFALYVPAWSAIFSRHVDKDRVSFDWSLDSTVAGLSAGASGFLGGVLADQLGFTSVFIFAAFFSLASAFVLLLAPDVILPKKQAAPALRDHTPKDLGQ